VNEFAEEKGGRVKQRLGKQGRKRRVGERGQVVCGRQGDRVGGRERGKGRMQRRQWSRVMGMDRAGWWAEPVKKVVHDGAF
jgi:hypothetical protein